MFIVVIQILYNTRTLGEQDFMETTIVAVAGKGTNPKTTLYVGGLEETITESTLHAAFIPFGDIKDVNIPLDHASGKHRGFGFVEYEEKDDAAAAIDNMHNAELFGRVLKVNYAQPMKIKGGDKGWSHQAVWADADKYMEEMEAEQELEQLEKESKKKSIQGIAPEAEAALLAAA
ncbi:hypothetical protein CEUSTIGMA_g5496.t1 [Chlamydomonas eustigma]|uniref:RRM domain-containing protein n=1 Tax=Chlamydomonas eustigma TaxID=1157962 RepID=A0A250X4P2_9CHLO|nr:hypothetical protein CEUSTIGMA_g5496.t1 [Chlamydomonas eustigma]|eukprot:GAX78054.1 hypothetical protein CEUSTIGMA_g5496.t1 [Chlamydomonas eustigma]